LVKVPIEHVGIEPQGTQVAAGMRRTDTVQEHKNAVAAARKTALFRSGVLASGIEI
jgi:hypothetical protein